MATPVRLFGSTNVYIPNGGTQTIPLSGLSTTDTQYVSLGVYVNRTGQVGASGAVIGNTQMNPAIIQPTSLFQITEVQTDTSSGSLYVVVQNTSGSTISGFGYITGIGV